MVTFRSDSPIKSWILFSLTKSCEVKYVYWNSPFTSLLTTILFNRCLSSLSVLLISLSVSNPVYQAIIKKYLDIPLLVQIILRFFLFILGLITIFFGLFVESIF